MQSLYIFVENVFVVGETGQSTMYCIIHSEEFLCIFIKSLMWSLCSLFQRIDRVNHGGECLLIWIDIDFQISINPNIQVLYAG